MIEILKNVEINILPQLLNNVEAWNGFDIKTTNPRTYLLWTKYDNFYITFTKTFYCGEKEINYRKSSEDIAINFLDGFWEVFAKSENNEFLFKEENNNYSSLNKEDDYDKKTFLIKKDSEYYFRSYKQRDWIYAITLSQEEPCFDGKLLKNEIKESLLKSAKILIF